MPRPEGQGIPEMITSHLALSFIIEKVSETFFDPLSSRNLNE
jgi:hypothetical protein